MSEQWTKERAWEWYDARPWLCGFNYLPSTAVNSTDTWQGKTFDPDTIRRELAWARDVGLNCCRVFLQFVVWEADPEGMADRLGQFLEIAEASGIVTLPILFDDCAFANREPYTGPQDEPTPGIHNSGWTPSPGPLIADDQSAWPRLRDYVHSLVSRFADDPRVLAWDVYNEPGNSDRLGRSLPLLRAATEWVRECGPTQPVTAGVWVWDEAFADLNAFSLAASDVVTYHEYADLNRQREVLARLREMGRPVLCTEWMSRTLGSPFETHLPFFRRERMGCFFWGLVNGRTQTHFPWGSVAGAPPPPVWFHDLLDAEGGPYRAEEVARLREEIAADQPGRRL